MKAGYKLKRLLDPQNIAALLSHWAPQFGPGVLLGVFDAQGQRLDGRAEVTQTEWSQLWQTIARQEIHVARDADVAAWPLALEIETVGALVMQGPYRSDAITAATTLVVTLETLIAEANARRAIAQETLERYREINVLYSIGETLGACLELDEVCRLVLSESMKLINCRRGAVLLVKDEEKRDPPAPLALAVGVGLNSLSGATLREGLSIAEAVVQNGRPKIVNDFQPEGWLRIPVVCAPLRFQEDVLGAVLLAEKAQGQDFTAADEKLLFALSTQAASSIKNARLFESVKRQRDEIATMKSFMDNIFASIASGVITTNMEDLITSFNRAAESILNLSSQEVLNRPYQQALDFMNETLLPRLMRDVQKNGQTFIDFEISPNLPIRGPVHLNVSLSRLRGSSETPLGVTMVVDDVTDKKKIERERRMVRRYLPSELVDSLPDNLDELKLRGERQTITTLFADIRGFTTFSEAQGPELVVQVINRYFDLAAQAVREHYGIIDKYLGDAVMALFNPPLLARETHAWDAVQAAWQLKEAIKGFHSEVEPEERLNLGVGICTGEAVVGNVGTLDRMEYTAIGDSVNVAKRLQENAAAGQILMSRSTWEQVKEQVHANPLPAVTLKGRQTLTEVFELVAIK
jgi:PAS domain S-box-containing protein